MPYIKASTCTLNLQYSKRTEKCLPSAETKLHVHCTGKSSVSRVNSLNTGNKKLCYCRGTCDALVSRNPASHLKTVSCGNLRDSTFSRFDTIPECDRHTDRRKDTRRRPTALSIASRGKNRPYYTAHQLSHCRQRATVDSRMYSYYHIFER